MTKYFYFVTGYNFPILDKHVKTSYRDFKNKVTELKDSNSLKENDIVNFIENMTILKNKLNTTFDKLDQLLWLTGKIKTGSISKILKRKEYETFLEEVKEKLSFDLTDAKDSETFDNEMVSIFDSIVEKDKQDLNSISIEIFKFLKYIYKLKRE